MLPTEVTRIALLIGLAVAGYLLILAWNEDYMRSGPELDYAPAPVPQQTGPSMLPQVLPQEVSQQPSTPVAGAADPGGLAGPGESDVPDASLISGVEVAPTGPVAATAVGSERLVYVKTPKLEVWIDRLGGDIVRVQLPQYPVDIDRPDVPFLLLDNGAGHTYIAQSGLFGEDGIDTGGGRPLYAARASSYEVATGEVRVELTTLQDGLDVTKTYHFAADDSLVNVEYRVRNLTDRTIKASMFAQIKRDSKEPFGESSFSLGPQPYLGAALTTAENRYEKLEFDDLDEGNFQTTQQGGWIAFLQHYFLSAWIANPEEINNYYGQRRNDGTYMVGFSGPLKEVSPGAVGEWSARFYAGPKDQKRLEEIAENLNLTVDYGFLWWIAVPLFYILDWLHSYVGNWGGAIILLTVLVKLVLYPLSAHSYKSMANMRRVAPQMKRLQERHADDRQKLSQEMMALYKKEKVNPLGGCLPMLLPMPIFLALYWVLFESVELRHAPFALWINDLAAMDPYFVLPLLMGGSMYLQQLMSPAVGDPMQVRMMRLMPVMFTVMFLFFPAGLVLYWLVNSVLSIAQQWYVIKQTEGA
ncbi:MAG: membrane protein insertase YidC [Gammaproteobacteria bacterium]|nr:membrane protein insertase YidC [Gammaproteobacteria bacterium]